MAPTIRIDDAVYAWLQEQARPFEDTPNSVLRRIAKLDEAVSAPEKPARVNILAPADRKKTPQPAYREPILKILLAHGGEASRGEVMQELEKSLARQLTPFDKETVESGAVRWQKTAEFQLHLMRKAKLVRPVEETTRGVWALTKKGEGAARDL